VEDFTYCIYVCAPDRTEEDGVRNGIRQCMLKIFGKRRIVTGRNVLGTEYQRTECAGDGLSENRMYGGRTVKNVTNCVQITYGIKGVCGESGVGGLHRD
jgi:hypothetical protein